MLALVIVAGLASGTFYSLTMTFVLTNLPKRLVIFGIAAYAADIVFVSNIASFLEGWYIDNLSWRWIFWTAALFTPLMIVCVHFGIPRRINEEPRPSWIGFTYFSLSLALLYGALDQGQRLDWLNSSTIVGMLVAGLFLFAATILRRVVQPNPIVNLKISEHSEHLHPGHIHLRIQVPAPVHDCARARLPRQHSTLPPLETGHALAWVALPMFMVVWLAATIIIYTNSRLVLALGLTVCAICCWLWSHVDTSWSGNNFEIVELLLSLGLAGAYIGLVGSIVLEALESGALASASNVATFSGFMHLMRIFGGQIGVAAMTRFIAVREQFHSNMLGLYVQRGSWLTDQRLRMLAGGLLPESTGQQEAQHRAATILGLQVRAQAYTLATSDGFVLIVWVVIVYLLLMLLLRPGKITFNDLSKMQ